MANKYRGETPVKIGRKTYKLAYDWNAIATLRSQFGADYFDKLAKAADESDVRFLAEVIAVGLRKHHDKPPTPDEVISASPPIIPMIEAINTALTAANWGPDGPPEEDGSQNPPKNLPTLLRALFAPQARQG
ncbi:MAG TPA: hypothetical protein VKA19_14900 [Alphaproteobacteria bacterium]|nr:hypothetical protein [Alphaproteobacteria bacterium]